MLGALLCITACSKDDDDKSSAKEIKSFQIVNLTPNVNGVIDEKAKTISVTVPYGTDITGLTPKIIISDKATVSPASETASDFTKAVSYKVTAEDGSTATYVVTVVVSANGEGGGEGGDLQSQVLSGTMSENTTLKDRGLAIDYVIDGRFDLEGNACLTIEAGVTIAFANVDSYIEVGENAGMKVMGEQGNPVKFTGPINNQNKGSWGWIEYKSKRSDNQLQFVTFENGGARNAVIYLTGAKVSINNCTINGSLGNGILSSASEVTSFYNNTIKNCDGAPFVSDNLEAFQNLKDGNVYSNNGKNMLTLTNGINVSDMKDKKATIKAQGIPYLFQGNINVTESSELTVEPGVTIQMEAGWYFEADGGSTITMEGTEAKPINLVSTSEKVYFRGVFVQNNCELSMKNVNISNVEDNQAIYVNEDYVKVALENVKISNSRNYGVYFRNERSENLSFSQKNVTFENCADGNIYHGEKGEAVSEFAASYPVPTEE